MKIFFPILILLPILSFSQPVLDDGGHALIVCRIEMEASTDWSEWKTFLENSLVLDHQSLDSIPAGTYIVMARFAIDSSGRINDVSVLKDPGFGLGARVKRSFETYRGCWKPAQINGRVVGSYRNQPITFIVEEPDDCEGTLPQQLIL